MAFTEHWSILNDLPLFWDPEALADGYYSNRFHRDLPSRFALVPRHGTTDDIRWFEADPTFVLHWTNAYEDGDEVVLDGFFQHNPTARGVARSAGELKGFETLDMNVLEARAHRWRFNLVTGETTEESTERPVRRVPHGQRSPRRPSASLLLQRALRPRAVRLRRADQARPRHRRRRGRRVDPGVFVSETVMAPRDGSTAEDDGYLVTFTSDIVNDRSECLILDAARPTDGPVARIRLPERISSGTHSTWAPLADL